MTNASDSIIEAMAERLYSFDPLRDWMSHPYRWSDVGNAHKAMLRERAAGLYAIAQEQRGWRGIASAPRTGEWFVIRIPYSDGYLYEAGRYAPYNWTEFEEVENGLYRKVEKPMGEWSSFNNFHAADAWCSLPGAPPASEGEETR